MLEHAERVRLDVTTRTDRGHKAKLGQFMTPATVARFMAALFPASRIERCRLLDPGCGVGALTCAFLDRWEAGGFGFAAVNVTAYEIDSALRGHLANALAAYSARHPRTIEICIDPDDFIASAVNRLQFCLPKFTHAILNPPYKKINTDSDARLLLREVGIETVNLYTAFVALALALLEAGGQLIAIIPRSFCNGPYYRPFRDFVFERAALRHLHLFDSRNSAFKEDAVLQENVIIALERGGVQGEVTVTTSTDDSFADLTTTVYPFDQIVFPSDTERFIHVPTERTERAAPGGYMLADLALKVSTGPVVDFRLREHLRDAPEPSAVPMLYANHFSGQRTLWPLVGAKKPSAIMRNAQTEHWLMPTGFYCVTRRFSSKEERRRVVAYVVDPTAFAGAEMLGFENHLNVFHENKHGLTEALARGLAVFLNSTAVDADFRRFSGHTQVNATDLRTMRFPSRADLTKLGDWAKNSGELTQAMIDEQVGALAR